MSDHAHRMKAVVIGGSAGSIASLSVILKELPANFRLPMFLTVHVPPRGRNNVLVDVLQKHCKLTVTEAEDKAPICEGTLYIAPPDYHVLIENPDTLALSVDDPVLFSRPSIDVMFESAADVYGDELVGVLLSGANQDGARGLRAIHQAGGVALVEDPAVAYASAMPAAALAVCPEAQVGTPHEIATYLKHL